MEPWNETRSEIIRIGAEILGRSGFKGSGLDSILKRAKVPKGSFYYYFRSKEDFALAVIDRAAVEYSQKLQSHLKNFNQSPLKRIRSFLEAGVTAVENDACTRGCLIGNLGQELASQSEIFRKRIDAVFRSWIDQIAECFQEAVKAGELPADCDPGQLAGFLLMGWEGAILRAKVMSSTKPLRDFIDVFFRTVAR